MGNVNGTEARIKVLFIDDEPLILRSVERMMARNDRFQCFFAERATAALDVMEHQDIDIVVSDYDMPECNGLELLGMLRAAHNEIVRIMMTGRLAMSAWEQGVDGGAVQRLIQKPWSNDGLRRILDEAADAVHARRARNSSDAHQTQGFRRPIALV